MNRMPVALAAALALGLAIAPAISATAADAPPATPTWSVQASGASGSDGRLSFVSPQAPGCVRLQGRVRTCPCGVCAT